MKANQLSQRWPFPKQELAGDLDKIFKQFFHEVRPGAWAPDWDVSETDQAYRVTLDLPGFASEDLSIEVKEGRLTVSGQRESQTLEEGEKLHLRERRFGKFQRVIEFQDPVDHDGISARMTNGVLKIEVPKSQKAQPRKIDIQTEA